MNIIMGGARAPTMKRRELLERRVQDLRFRGAMRAGELVEGLGAGGGFSARKVAEALGILEAMVKEEGCTTFLAFPAAPMATGTRGALVELVRRGLVDCIITTCGTLDHDLARSWSHYYHGEFEMDDAALHREGINRLGNVLVPNESYGKVLEERLQPMFREIYAQGVRRPSTRELAWEVGKRLVDEGSLLLWAQRRRIPLFVPAPYDGAFGYQLWSFWQEHKDFGLDLEKDEAELADLVFSAKRSGALMIGGGVSKHHTLWWNQFRGGLDYAVYITTAVEYDGSLSGARMREAISWGKVRDQARQITVEGDATLVLPLLVAALLDRLPETSGGPR